MKLTFRPSISFPSFARVAAVAAGAAALMMPGTGTAQVFTVGASGVGKLPPVHQTDIVLSDKPLQERGRREIMRAMQAEQGFAMRAIPRGHKGITLHANGPLEPKDSGYEKMLEDQGISVNGGDRIAITDVLVDKNKIIFLLNGGPDKRHRILRHISIGAGGMETPLAQDDGIEPVGSKVTLEFAKFVPEMSGDEVMALLHPVIAFNVKTPVEAYTDTLPPKLRDAIRNHQVLVGMDRKMVFMALGQPLKKVREKDEHNWITEEWIYGTAPEPTQFVRFSGNRVIRMEIAELGKAPVIRDQDETDGFFNRTVVSSTTQLGDAVPTEGEGAQKKAPTLRAPGDPEPEVNKQEKVQLPPNLQKPNDQQLLSENTNGGSGAR